MVFTSECYVRSYMQWVTVELPEDPVKAGTYATIDTAGIVHTKKNMLTIASNEIGNVSLIVNLFLSVNSCLYFYPRIFF